MNVELKIPEDLQEMYTSLPKQHPARQFIERIARAEAEVKFLKSAPCPFESENAELKAQLEQLEESRFPSL
jgi:hypothetical protein